MTSKLRFTLVSLFLVFVARASAAVTLTNIIDEQCPVVVYVQDMPTLIKNWNQSPWAKTWNDEQIKKFLAPMRAQMKVDQWDDSCKAETGYTVSELLAMAKGQVLFVLTSADLPYEEANPDPSRFPVLMAIELGDNAAKMTKIISANDEKEHATVRIEDFAGVKLHIYQKSAEQGGGDEFLWAIADGIWLIGPSKATIQKSIDSIQKGRVASPLGESERFLKIKKQNPDANITFLLNIQALYPGIKTLAEKQSERNGSQPMGMAPSVILDAIGLNTLRDFYLTVDMGESATNLTGGLTYSELRGLLKIIAYRDGPVSQPAFVSEKWITVSTACFSLQDAYVGLKDFLEALNPMIAGIAQTQIKNLNQQLGIDLEHDLIGSTGHNIIAANAMRPGANVDTPAPLAELDQLYAIELVNAPSFTKAIDALKGMMGPQADKMFEKREYLGQTIYTAMLPKQQPGQKGISYAITPKYLFVAAGSASVLETALQGLDGKHPTLWQKPEVKAALAELPATASGFEYQNTRAMVGSMIETIVQLAPMFAAKSNAASDEGGEADEGKPAAGNNVPFDVSAKPDAATLAKYWSDATGHVWRDSQGLYLHSKVNHVK